MSIIVIGIDLAKSIFAVHGVNQNGKAELVKPRVSRERLLPLTAQLPPCLIGMEACSGAHHWDSHADMPGCQHVFPTRLDNGQQPPLFSAKQSRDMPGLAPMLGPAGRPKAANKPERF